MIEINLLEQLVAFHQYGTLSKAAEVLHTSQPALTRAMQRLEDELGVPLFIRTKNRLLLNKTGEMAAELAENVLKEDRYLEQRVHDFDRSLHTLSIGFCAPVPQQVLTPLINSLYVGMTISSDMGDDKDYLKKLTNHDYQLAVLHYKPLDPQFYCKKIGHEDLFISLRPSDPLTFYPEIHLQDLNGKSILLFSQIGFWKNLTLNKTQDVHYLLQVERSSFEELALNSDYPSFSSSYYLNHQQSIPGRINVSIADKECHTDYYLVCLASEQDRFNKLFRSVNERTIF